MRDIWEPWSELMKAFDSLFPNAPAYPYRIHPGTPATSFDQLLRRDKYTLISNGCGPDGRTKIYSRNVYAKHLPKFGKELTYLLRIDHLTMISNMNMEFPNYQVTCSDQETQAELDRLFAPQHKFIRDHMVDFYDKHMLKHTLAT